MRKQLFILFALVCILGISINAVAGGPNTDPRCDGLSGAAFGMCAAAIAVGCDDPANSNSGCDKIEENFAQITGEEPPWTEACPCWTINELISISAEYSGFSCSEGEFPTEPQDPAKCVIDMCGCNTVFCCTGTALLGDHLIEFGPLLVWYNPNGPAYGCSVLSIDPIRGTPVIDIDLEITADEYRICGESLGSFI